MANETLNFWEQSVDTLIQDQTVRRFEDFIRELLQKLINGVEIAGKFDLDKDGWNDFLNHVRVVILRTYGVADLMTAIQEIDQHNCVIGGNNLEQYWESVAHVARRTRQ